MGTDEFKKREGQPRDAEGVGRRVVEGSSHSAGLVVKRQCHALLGGVGTGTVSSATTPAATARITHCELWRAWLHALGMLQLVLACRWEALEGRETGTGPGGVIGQ